MHSGEDWKFVEWAMYKRQFIVGEAKDYFIASIHPGNTAQRVIGDGWIELQK
jgi:hypothetical protein